MKIRTADNHAMSLLLCFINFLSPPNVWLHTGFWQSVSGEIGIL